MNSSTTKKQSWLQRFPFHPLLFAAYPILALLAFNITELDVSAGVRSLFVSMLLAVILFLVFRFIFHDSNRAALLSSALLILFYSYGHLYNQLIGIEIAGIHPFQHRTLLPLWSMLAVLAVWWTSRKNGNVSTWTYGLNAVGLVLLLLPLFQITSFYVQSAVSESQAESESNTLDLTPGSQPPDIYYIILDGYGRSDAVKKYGFDNSDFLSSLRGLGFYVAECAQSNYAQTKMSLTSSLNFDYLDQLSDRFVEGSSDRTGMSALLQHNAVRKSLEKAGYKTISFASGFPMTEFTNADYFFAPHTSWGELNDFESLLVKTTFAGSAEPGSANTASDMPNSDPALSRERTRYVLANLDKVASIQGPKFVFVHLVIPHPPFVFGPTGGPPAPDQEGISRTKQIGIHYRDQAMYISSRIMEIVPRIIANSATPPVIVIQGDHGPTVPSDAHNRMKILNVYYLPSVDAKVYPTITPVNTFRVIFNSYFGQHLELLDDVSLYSTYRRPFNYRVIANNCKAN
jgi:hypothetical protein